MLLNETDSSTFKINFDFQDVPFLNNHRNYKETLHLYALNLFVFVKFLSEWQKKIYVYNNMLVIGDMHQISRNARDH